MTAVRRVGARPHGDDGASAAEYSLLAAAVAALLVVVLFFLGDVVSGLFSQSCDAVRAKAAPTGTC